MPAPEVTGQTRLLGLVRWPPAASLSFAMQNAALQALGLDWLYVPAPVEPGRLKEAFAGLAAAGFGGWNVTLPHKEAAAALVDRLVGPAARLRAVNTVVVAGGSLEGHNTDVEGIRRSLSGLGLAGRALIVGAGGAAAAAVLALQGLGLSVTVTNRTDERARHLAGRLGADFVPWSQALTVKAAAVVNATAVGDPRPDLKPDEATLVFDLHYLPTPLLARSPRTLDGLEMLVQQGAESLRLWTGLEPPVDLMRRAALTARQRMATPA